MSFHDVRLPENIEINAQGGPAFKTNVLELSSGHEKRNINWSRSRGKWSIGYALATKQEQEAILAFFYARRGKAHAFRFKDWTDFQIGDPSKGVFQRIAISDGTKKDFQIFRTYKDKFKNFERPITRPVLGSLSVSVDGKTDRNWTLRDKGILRFSKVHKRSTEIAISCEFDVPVRFESDDFVVAATGADHFSVPSIEIIEIKENLAV